MMRRVFEKLRQLTSEPDFFTFQHQLARDIYEALGQGYASNDGEVDLVKKLIDAVNEKGFKGLRLHAEIIHGSRSYVEFNYMDKPVTKELGDMFIISLVTAGRQRVFQRLCIVQNKKSQGDKWAIDQEQLYLLKNFPAFTGNKGIFRGSRDLIFRNNSGCLGAFGFFNQPGELLLASAPLVTEMLRGQNMLKAGDISVYPQTGIVGAAGAAWGPGIAYPFFYPFFRNSKELFFFLEEILPRYGWGLPMSSTILGNAHFCRDAYDFSRDCTQMNIGEPTYAFDRVLNPHVDAFTNLVLKNIHYEHPEIPEDNVFGDFPFGGSAAVLLFHLDIKKEE
jgi:hypothetical protein